jgi:hypothetical protein
VSWRARCGAVFFRLVWGGPKSDGWKRKAEAASLPWSHAATNDTISDGGHGGVMLRMLKVAAAIDDICPMSQWRCASLPHGLFACATFRAPRRTHSPERQPRQQMLKGRVVPLYLLFMRVQYRDGRISIILDKADDLPVEPQLTPYARWSTKTSAGRIIPSPLFCSARTTVPPFRIVCSRSHPTYI